MGSTWLLWAALAALVPIQHALSQTPLWKPEKNVEIIAGVSPGGAQDRTARVIYKVIQDRRLVGSTCTVINKPGGGGTISLAYLNQHTGDAHYLLISSVPILVNHIIGRSPLTFTDFTPIAQLFNEYVAFAVRIDSPLKSGKDLVDQMKQNAVSLSIAVGTTLGNTNHIAVAKVAKTAGVDIRRLKAVVFNSTGDAVTALMGGHVQVVSAPPSNIASQVEAGKLRVIAIAAPSRLPGALSNVPTWKEQGLNVIVASDRGVIGPKGIRRAQITYWENILREVTETEEWKKDLETNFWVANYLRSDDASVYLKALYADLRNSLIELGLAK
jgi:putative tricarboxylic transport membrane protein